jgi:hypothetical protein
MDLEKHFQIEIFYLKFANLWNFSSLAIQDNFMDVFWLNFSLFEDFFDRLEN